MPADDAMMATINADAANDLGSQNAFYDPNVHVNFNDASLLHSAHGGQHFAPWDIPAFAHNVSQINPFEIPTAQEDVSPDTGSIMTRRRRAILHRQSALIEPDSSAAQVSISLSTRFIFWAYHINLALYFQDVHVSRAAPLSLTVRCSSACQHPSAGFSPGLQSRRLTSYYAFQSTIMGQCLRRFDLLRSPCYSEHLQLPFERLHWQSSFSREHSEYLDIL